MGIAVIVNEFTGWPLGLIMLAFNIPLLVLGFYYLGRFNFLIHTLWVVLIYSFGTDLMTAWLPASGLTDDLLLNAIYGGVLGGIGSIPGAVVGSLVLGWTESFFTGYISSDYEDVFAFIFLVLILIFRPAGILGRSSTEKV